MHFYLLRRQGHEAAEFRNSPGTTDLGLHAVEGVAEYQAALQRAAPTDFDAERAVLGADCRVGAAATEVGEVEVLTYNVT